MAVPAKRGKKPARSIRYLLSGDRKLRRLSLRKMADPVAKATSRRRPTRAKSPAEDKSSAAPRRSVSARPAILVVVAVFGAAALLTARQFSPAPQPDLAIVDAHLQPEATPPSNVELPEITKSAVTAPSVVKQSSGPARPSATKAAALKTTAAEPRKPAVVKATPKPVAAEPVDTDGEDSHVVTITGCVDRNGEMFRLKDTSGAPKTRSWRSGFLMRRRVASVDLVEASSALRLSDHVGKRVAATGGLIDREMRVRSLAIVSSACN
jgi:hypothetical protein